MTEDMDKAWKLLREISDKPEFRFVRLEDGTYLFGNGDIFEEGVILGDEIEGEIFLYGRKNSDIEMIIVRFKQ